MRRSDELIARMKRMRAGVKSAEMEASPSMREASASSRSLNESGQRDSSVTTEVALAALAQSYKVDEVMLRMAMESLVGGQGK